MATELTFPRVDHVFYVLQGIILLKAIWFAEYHVSVITCYLSVLYESDVRFAPTTRIHESAIVIERNGNYEINVTPII